MSAQSYHGMSIDAEGVADESSFSKLTIASLLLLIVGIFAPVEPRLAVVSGIAGVLSLVSILISKRSNFSTISQSVACVVLFLATMTTIWAVVVYQVQLKRQETRAVEIANIYMQALAESKMLTAIKMVGLDPVVREDDDSQNNSVAQKAVRVYLEDYAIKQVINGGSDVSWVSEGVIETRTEPDPGGRSMEIYKVRFHAADQKNPRPFDVIVNFVPPSKYAEKQTYRWMIDKLEIPEN